MAIFKAIFDGEFVAQLFHKNERGETVFYPSGILGKGYIVPKERETEVRSGMRRVMGLSLLAALISIIGMLVLLAITDFATWAYAVTMAAVAAIAVVVFYFSNQLTVGLRPATAVGANEWLRRASLATPAWSNWVSVVLGVTALLEVPGSFATAETWQDTTSGVILIVVGILLTLFGLRGLFERTKLAKQS